MRLVSVALLFLVSAFGWGATPGGAPDNSPTTYRVEAAEVHISFSAFDKQNLPVGDLSLSDISVLQDGQPLRQVVTLEKRHQGPIVATVLTDSSESMGKAIPMARESWRWMNRNLVSNEDHVSFLDFDDSMFRPSSKQRGGVYLTALHDSLIKLIPQIQGTPEARKALILFTDGVDNASYHTLQDVIDTALEEDVAVYAISTAKFRVRYDSNALNRLTGMTGGRFFVVENSDQMIFAIKLIEQDLRSGYEIVFRPSKGKAGIHRLAIKSPTMPLRFYHRAAYFQPGVPETGVVEVAAAARH
jgi:Ca-activated chloride channel family protein